MYVFLFKGKNLYKLKELYTSISTLAQNLGLTLLNDEFVLQIRNIGLGIQVSHIRRTWARKEGM